MNAADRLKVTLVLSGTVGHVIIHRGLQFVILSLDTRIELTMNKEQKTRSQTSSQCEGAPCLDSPHLFRFYLPPNLFLAHPALSVSVRPSASSSLSSSRYVVYTSVSVCYLAGAHGAPVAVQHPDLPAVLDLVVVDTVTGAVVAVGAPAVVASVQVEAHRVVGTGVPPRLAFIDICGGHKEGDITRTSSAEAQFIHGLKVILKIIIALLTCKR